MRVDGANLPVLTGEGLQVSQHQKNAASEDQKLKKVCREFGSVLVAQMLKEMRASLPKSDFFGSSEKEEMFQGMLDDEVAKEIANTPGFSIGDMLYQQLQRQKTR